MSDEEVVLPPKEILEDPAIHQTTISDIVEKEPLELTQDDLTRLVAALRAQRRNWAQLELEKSRGNVSPRARKLPAGPKKSAAEKIGIPGLELDLDALG